MKMNEKIVIFMQTNFYASSTAMKLFFVLFGAGYWYFRGVFDSGNFQKRPPWLKL